MKGCMWIWRRTPCTSSSCRGEADVDSWPGQCADVGKFVWVIRQTETVSAGSGQTDDDRFASANRPPSTVPRLTPEDVRSSVCWLALPTVLRRARYQAA